MRRNRQTIFPLLLLVAWIGVANANDGDQPRTLSATERSRIDKRALESADSLPFQKPVRFYDDVRGWMISQVTLPKEQESARAKAAHQELTKQFRIVETPPAVNNVFQRLVAELPRKMRTERGGPHLFVLADAQRVAYAVGDGRIYLSAATVKKLAGIENSGGRDQLAFLLAQQLGHQCRRHPQRYYRRQWIRQQKENSKAAANDDEKADESLNTAARSGEGDTSDKDNSTDDNQVGSILEYQFTRSETFRADLFAVHLCRNAGFKLENCLDLLRRQTMQDDSKTKKPTALARLKRLRVELDGLINGDEYGLFEYNRSTDEIERLTKNSIKPDERVVLFLHGMESDLKGYHPFIELLAKRDADLRILGFQYPNDGSLARDSKFLIREMKRCEIVSDHIDFICHSAGGLVFRHFVEVEQQGFRRAFFLGTPHAGSDLASLRPLLESKQFLGDLKLGLSPAMERAIMDGTGQIGFDLQTDSLFLRYLNRADRKVHRMRYHIFRGRAMKTSRALLLSTGLAIARRALNRKFAASDEPTLVRRFAAAQVDLLNLPREATHGDLAVTLKSATLEGVASITTVRSSHGKLRHNDKVMKEIADVICR